MRDYSIERICTYIEHIKPHRIAFIAPKIDQAKILLRQIRFEASCEIATITPLTLKHMEGIKAYYEPDLFIPIGRWYEYADLRLLVGRYVTRDVYSISYDGN